MSPDKGYLGPHGSSSLARCSALHSMDCAGASPSCRAGYKPSELSEQMHATIATEPPDLTDVEAAVFEFERVLEVRGGRSS